MKSMCTPTHTHTHTHTCPAPELKKPGRLVLHTHVSRAGTQTCRVDQTDTLYKAPTPTMNTTKTSKMPKMPAMTITTTTNDDDDDDEPDQRRVGVRGPADEGIRHGGIEDLEKSEYGKGPTGE